MAGLNHPRPAIKCSGPTPALHRLALPTPAPQAAEAEPWRPGPAGAPPYFHSTRTVDATKKWRNLQKNPKVALVIDDVVSVRPWKVRGVDIRGDAELLTGPHELGPHFSEELICVHPRRIHSWGLEE